MDVIHDFSLDSFKLKSVEITSCFFLFFLLQLLEQILNKIPPFHTAIGLFSGTVSISSQMTQCRIILLLQPITKLYLFTIELKLRDDFRCFRTFSTVPLNSPMRIYLISLSCHILVFCSFYLNEAIVIINVNTTVTKCCSSGSEV